MDPLPPIIVPPSPLAPLPAAGAGLAVKILVGVIATVVVATGGYLVTKFFVPVCCAPSLSLLPSPSATPTSTVPADWKTYTNAQYGFELKYPREGTLNVYDSSGQPVIYISVGSAEPAPYLYIKILKMSMSEWLKNSEQQIESSKQIGNRTIYATTAIDYDPADAYVGKVRSYRIFEEGNNLVEMNGQFEFPVDDLISTFRFTK